MKSALSLAMFALATSRVKGFGQCNQPDLTPYPTDAAQRSAALVENFGYTAEFAAKLVDDTIPMWQRYVARQQSGSNTWSDELKFAYVDINMEDYINVLPTYVTSTVFGDWKVKIARYWCDHQCIPEGGAFSTCMCGGAGECGINQGSYFGQFDVYLEEGTHPIPNSPAGYYDTNNMWGGGALDFSLDPSECDGEDPAGALINDVCYQQTTSVILHRDGQIDGYLTAFDWFSYDKDFDTWTVVSHDTTQRAALNDELTGPDLVTYTTGEWDTSGTGPLSCEELEQEWLAADCACTADSTVCDDKKTAWSDAGCAPQTCG